MISENVEEGGKNLNLQARAAGNFWKLQEEDEKNGGGKKWRRINVDLAGGGEMMGRFVWVFCVSIRVGGCRSIRSRREKFWMFSDPRAA